MSGRSAGRPRGDARETWLLLAPYLVGLAGLIVVPGIVSLALSLFEYDMVRPPVFIGTDKFGELLADDVFRISLRNSMAFVALAIPLRLLAVVTLALLLHRHRRGGTFLIGSIVLPIVVPEVAYAIAWLWIFNPLYGPLNMVLGALGAGPVPWLTDPQAAQASIVVMSLFTVGEAFLVVLVVRRSMPRELYDMAAIEGASSFDMLRRITLPLLWPVLLLLTFRDVALSLQTTFVPALVVTGGGPPPYATTYLSLFIYREGFEYLRYGYAAAATVVALGIVAVLALLQLRVLNRWRSGASL